MPEPQKIKPSVDWEHFILWERVNDLLYALPSHFDTDLVIRGINVTEIFSIGTALSTVVESKVVEILNQLRNRWDPEQEYPEYAFFRQAQTFPDVLLRHVENSDDILFGIELKSWYVLSKEGEPSFRYKVTPAACADADLLVVIPWILSEVISGEPRLLLTYTESARYVAEYRNYYWQNSRTEREKDPTITAPAGQITPYPNSKEEASDKAEDDKGGNFGRIARTGILDNYVNKTKAQEYLGVKLLHWLDFFKAFTETNTDVRIKRKLDALRKRIAADETQTDDLKDTYLVVLEQVERLWQTGN